MSGSSPLALSATGRRWAIATPHTAATDSGVRAFEAGGNAVDAALAAATALAVVYPHMCGVGGDLFALVREADGKVLAFNASGAAPGGTDLDAIRSRYDRMPEHGPDSITVPGAVSGWALLHGEGAALPWESLFRDAIGFADDGVPIARSVHKNLSSSASHLRDDPGMRNVFFPDGDVPAEGSLLRQPALASSLRTLSTQGPDALYRGAIGSRYVSGLREAGCPITEEDLDRHDPELGSPIAGRFAGHDVLVVPPNSQGYVLPLILAAVERLGLGPDPLGPDAALLASLFLAASEDRDRHNADPRVVGVRIDALLDDGHVADIARSARDRLEASSGAAARVRAESATVDGTQDRGDGDTIALVTADGDGRAVCLIQSLYDGFGSGILEPTTGIVAHNRGACFVLDPHSRNVLAPHKRPAHTLMPSMLVRDGRLALVPGTKGGAAQPQINALNVLRVIGMGMAPDEALAAPRWTVDGTGPDGDTPFLAAEGRVPPRVRTALATTGLGLQLLDDLDGEAGHAHLIAAGDDGALTAAADPRSDGSAAAG